MLAGILLSKRFVAVALAALLTFLSVAEAQTRESKVTAILQKTSGPKELLARADIQEELRQAIHLDLRPFRLLIAELRAEVAANPALETTGWSILFRRFGPRLRSQVTLTGENLAWIEIPSPVTATWKISTLRFGSFSLAILGEREPTAGARKILMLGDQGTFQFLELKPGFGGTAELIVERLPRLHADSSDWFSNEGHVNPSEPRTLEPLLRTWIRLDLPKLRAELHLQKIYTNLEPSDFIRFPETLLGGITRAPETSRAAQYEYRSWIVTEEEFPGISGYWIDAKGMSVELTDRLILETSRNPTHARLIALFYAYFHNSKPKLPYLLTQSLPEIVSWPVVRDYVETFHSMIPSPDSREEDLYYSAQLQELFKARPTSSPQELREYLAAYLDFQSRGGVDGDFVTTFLKYFKTHPGKIAARESFLAQLHADHLEVLKTGTGNPEQQKLLLAAYAEWPTLWEGWTSLKKKIAPVTLYEDLLRDPAVWKARFAANPGLFGKFLDPRHLVEFKSVYGLLDWIRRELAPVLATEVARVLPLAEEANIGTWRECLLKWEGAKKKLKEALNPAPGQS